MNPGNDTGSGRTLKTSEILEQAAAFAKKGKLTEAAELYNFVLKNFPYDKRAKKGLKDLKKRGKVPFSGNDVERILAQLNAGNVDAALSSARRLCKDYPNEATAHYVLGLSLSASGEKESAANAFAQALSLAPDLWMAQQGLAEALTDLGAFNQALETYHKLLHSGHASPEIYTGLGKALRGARMYKDALEAFDRALKLRALDADTYNHRGDVLHDLERHDEAIDAYEKALEIDPEHREALLNLAQSLLSMRRFVPAANSFGAYLKLEPKSEIALGGLAKALLLSKQYTAAAEKFDQLLKLSPDNGVARHMAAALTGRRQEVADPEYARSLFEGYAARFEGHLTKELGYNLPEQVPALLQQLDGEDAWYENALDIGCGTGLVGTEIRSFCSQLVGIDVAEAMVRKADEKAVYNQLFVGDVLSWLKTNDRSFDLMVCTDVVIYIGALDQFFKELHAHMSPGARLIVSTERQADGDFDLLRSGRYSHSDPYVEECARTAGLEVTSCQQVDLRLDADEMLEGSLFVLTKSSDQKVLETP